MPVAAAANTLQLKAVGLEMTVLAAVVAVLGATRVLLVTVETTPIALRGTASLLRVTVAMALVALVAIRRHMTVAAAVVADLGLARVDEMTCWLLACSIKCNRLTKIVASHALDLAALVNRVTDLCGVSTPFRETRDGPVHRTCTSA